MENLNRERTIYQILTISSDAYFRKLYDVIDQVVDATELNKVYQNVCRQDRSPNSGQFAENG